MHFARITTLALASLCLLAGCGSNGDSESGDAAEPRTTATSAVPVEPTSAAALQGVYRATLKANPSNRITAGVWRLRVEGRDVSLRVPGSAEGSDAGSPAAVSAGVLRLGVTPLCRRKTEARYSFRRTGDRLELRPIDDRCDFRRAVLGASWRAAKP